MNNEILVFTHNDLDALGCMLNLHYKLPDKRFKYFHTNYGNLSEITDEVCLYQQQNSIEYLFIMDVSFADRKQCLDQLDQLDCTTIFIDHHLYPDGFFDGYKMKIYHDKDHAATSLAYKVFKNANENLERISYLIETYDIWKRERPEFHLAHIINEYFWLEANQMDLEHLMYKFIDNDYKLPKDFKQVTETLLHEVEEHKANLAKRNLIFKTERIAIYFSSKYHGFILMDEFESGKDVCLIINDYGIIRIRINDECKLSYEQKNKIRLLTTGNTNIGHENAFTYKSAAGFDNIMGEIQKTANIIQKELDIAYG